MSDMLTEKRAALSFIDRVGQLFKFKGNKKIVKSLRSEEGVTNLFWEKIVIKED